MASETVDKNCINISDSSNNNVDLEYDTNQIPEWLNKDYMENILKIYKNDKSLKITSFKVKPALGKGENFGGVMTRIQLQYICKCSKSLKDGYYIAKSSFEDDAFSMEKMKDYDIFNREIDIYQNILPKLREYLNEINDKEIIFPTTIYVDYKNSGILFEDLSVESFIMPDRTKGLDEAHIKLALRKLAKLHATSAVLNEREPNSFKTYDRGFFNRHTNSYASFFENNLRICGETVKKFGPEYIKYSEKIEKLVPQLMDIGRKLFDVQEHEFNSFVHGDFWVNNLLYKYDEKQINKPLEAIILDYQYSFYGSSVLDLLYFMNTSMKEELRLSEEDKYIQYYYNFLVETLKKLKFNGKIPTLHEFHIQYITKEFFAFHSSCVIQPVMLNEETEDADFNALMAEDERAFNFKRTIYKNKRVVQNLKKLLPHFDRRGILDTKLENL
ncbi:uncharacterized protein LOC129608190 [Condylostylus longicornis]|uniref:uncharacterized protein LOC129608190 n=1 Tax=Condylostylus longicornis TaxID=2530218 RepID=UPI00244E28CD|nr:uncharacterized protein LOC129608190 [Condylostylus longicornis]